MRSQRPYKPTSARPVCLGPSVLPDDSSAPDGEQGRQQVAVSFLGASHCAGINTERVLPFVGGEDTVTGSEL